MWVLGNGKTRDYGKDKILAAGRRDDIDYIARMLQGQESKDLFHDAVAYYSTGNVKYLLRHKPSRERYLYHARNILRGETRVVDCGAYTGDTLASVLKRFQPGTGRLEYDAFEPDRANFEKLSRMADRISRDDVTVRPVRACAYDSGFPVGFSYNLGPGCRICMDSGETAPSLRLEDEIRTGLPVDLLKVSVCGAEFGTLAGARGLIGSDRPYLAVSVPDGEAELLDICVYLMSVHPGYEWVLRSYSRYRPDLILYGRPDRW